MAEKSRKPKIRFTGCTEDWEQRKLEDLFKILPNNTLSRAELGFEKGIFKNLHYGDILIKFNEILDGCDKRIPFINRNINFEKIKNAILKNGDIVIADAAEDETVGKCTELLNVSQGEQIVSGLHTIPCRPNIQFAQGFLGYYMNSNSYHSQLIPLMQGIKVLSLSKSSLQDTLIAFPLKRDEQVRIGTFFRHLDRLITLHQRKCERLVNIKKAMLEKMFPEKGADVPEVRFAGFTEAWEQRKVGEYYDFKNGLNKGKEYFGLGTPIVNFTDVFHLRGIYEKDLKGKVNLTKPEIANFQVRVGDIFFTRTSETIDEIGFPSVMLDDPEDTVFSGFVLRGRALQDDPLTLQFKRYVFFTNAFRKEMIKKSSMTTRALTSGTAIKNMVFIFPKNKEEQEIIGTFFRHLDHLITLHQRKVNLLHNIKKACLETMFV